MPHKLSYYEKISLKNKTPEEAERITELFNANINLANRVAQKYYKTKYWEFDEALQIARMGLWKACLIWDPDKYRLSTLAYNIINRDFIDYDRQQKRQPDILFNLEDNVVTEDISLSDVLIDEETNIENDFVEDNDIEELSQDIIWLLEDIAEDYKLNNCIVKLIYVVFIEGTQGNQLNTRMLDFIPKQVIKQVIGELQERLVKILN
jgi:RNA polymerase sigma factor (sigma-70 family)